MVLHCCCIDLVVDDIIIIFQLILRCHRLCWVCAGC